MYNSLNIKLCHIISLLPGVVLTKCLSQGPGYCYYNLLLLYQRFKPKPWLSPFVNMVLTCIQALRKPCVNMSKCFTFHLLFNHYSSVSYQSQYQCSLASCGQNKTRSYFYSHYNSVECPWLPYKACCPRGPSGYRYSWQSEWCP